MKTWPLLLLMLTAAGSTAAQDKVKPQDRVALKACLDKAYQGQGKAVDCIGVIEGPCRDEPEGSSTVGMRACLLRETAAWDERLNEAYHTAMGGAPGSVDRKHPGTGAPIKGTTLLRDAQRAWIAFRDKKCEADGLPMAGGSGAMLLTASCILGETARQSIWLESLREQF